MRILTVRLTAVAVVACIAANVTGATWDDDSADHNWTNAVNWSDNVVPGADDTVLLNHTGTGTSIVNADHTVRALAFANTNAAHRVWIAPGTTLTVNAGSLSVGYHQPNVTVMLSGGGALKIGNSIPTSLIVGYAHAGDGVGATWYANIFMTGGTFNLGNTSTIQVGNQQHGGYRGSVGVLDLSRAAIASGSDPDIVRLTTLDVGGGAAGRGTLKLNPTVTNITVGNLQLGGGGADLSVLNLGTNSQLKTLVVTNSLLLNRGHILSYDSGGNSMTGLPGNVAFRMGSHRRRSGTLSIACGGQIQRTVLELGSGIGTFEAYLSDLEVATGSVNGHHRYGVLDLRDSTLVALDVLGRVKIGGVSSHGKVYLPKGRATCGELQVGVSQAGTVAGDGLLSLSSTEFVVSGDVNVGDPHTSDAGLVTNRINGVSSGIDMTGTLTITNGGTMRLNFAGPPADPIRNYWGLRMAGNRTNLIASLHTAEKLSWSTAGLTAEQQERFGIHYDVHKDATFVGVPAKVIRGTITGTR